MLFDQVSYTSTHKLVFKSKPTKKLQAPSSQDVLYHILPWYKMKPLVHVNNSKRFYPLNVGTFTIWPVQNERVRGGCQLVIILKGKTSSCYEVYLSLENWPCLKKGIMCVVYSTEGTRGWIVPRHDVLCVLTSEALFFSCSSYITLKTWRLFSDGVFIVIICQH